MDKTRTLINEPAAKLAFNPILMEFEIYKNADRVWVGKSYAMAMVKLDEFKRGKE